MIGFIVKIMQNKKIIKSINFPAGKGDLFGTDINFDDPVGISSCDVRSLTYCDLQCINMKGLTDVLALYPDFAEQFQNDIRHDLTCNLKEGFDESEVSRQLYFLHSQI